jgi:hypothetical protein
MAYCSSPTVRHRGLLSYNRTYNPPVNSLKTLQDHHILVNQ